MRVFKMIANAVGAVCHCNKWGNAIFRILSAQFLLTNRFGLARRFSPKRATFFIGCPTLTNVRWKAEVPRSKLQMQWIGEVGHYCAGRKLWDAVAVGMVTRTKHSKA